MDTLPRNPSSSSFEMIEVVPHNSKSDPNEDLLIDLLASSPTLDYYFQAIKGLNNLQSGKRPQGLPAKAVYNAFLGHLVRGEVTTMHVRLAPNSILKASFKLKSSDKVYHVPFLDTENDSIWCQPRMYRGFHFTGFKGGNLAHRFYIDHLIISVEDVNCSFPMFTGGEILSMQYQKATVFGLLDDCYLNVVHRQCENVTILPETKQNPLISTCFEYLDFTSVILY